MSVLTLFRTEESDDDCGNAREGSSSQSNIEPSDLHGSESTSNSNNTPEMEGTECGSDIDDLSVSGSSTSCTTPPPELTPKGLSALLAS